MKETILNLLEKNSRLTAKEIAEQTGYDEKEVENTIKEMEKDRVICGYNTLINWDKTGRDYITALIEVKVTPQRGNGFDKVAERIYSFDEVKAVYLMSGGFDLCCMVSDKSFEEIALFVANRLSPLDGVMSTATHFILKKYKEQGVFFTEAPKDDRGIFSF